MHLLTRPKWPKVIIPPTLYLLNMSFNLLIDSIFIAMTYFFLKIVESKYSDYNTLESLSLLNDLNEMLEVVGWIDFVKWDKRVCEQCVGSFWAHLRLIGTSLTKISHSIFNLDPLICHLKPYRVWPQGTTPNGSVFGPMAMTVFVTPLSISRWNIHQDCEGEVPKATKNRRLVSTYVSY